MKPVRVLIVDDSLTMRALFGGILDRANGIDVVGMAANADEARQLMIALHPDVVTLDVEMPGMNGFDFLEEIMRERPTPVVMLSCMTGKGAEASFRALELGAVDCFGKPRSADPDEFKKLSAKLASLVIAASKAGARRATPKQAPILDHPFLWNGKIITMSGATGSVEALLHIVPRLPSNCPPTVITLQIDPLFVDPLMDRLRSSSAAKIVHAEAGQRLRQGTVYLATNQAWHAAIEDAQNPMLHRIDIQPVHGARPSGDVLFATAAKALGDAAVGIILSGMGEDGAAGLKLMQRGGALTVCQDAETSILHGTLDAVTKIAAAKSVLPLGKIAAAALAACSREAASGTEHPLAA